MGTYTRPPYKRLNRETNTWEWDDKTKTRGVIVEIDDSGISEEMAMDNHLLMVKKLNELIVSESSRACG